MALLCCFLLTVEKIPIVECERLYELTWSWAQSEGSKWPLGRQGPHGSDARPERRGESADATSAWEESGRGFQTPIKEACFEFAGPQEQLAECDKENRAGRGRPRQRGQRGGGAAGRPSSVPASTTGRRPQPQPRLEQSGVKWVLGLCLYFSAGWSPVPPSSRNARKRRAGKQEKSQDEQSQKESSRLLPAPPRLLFKAFSPFLSHARSLSLSRSLSPLEI